MFYKLLYYLTVYLPLRLRDLYINFFSLFVRYGRIIEAAHKLFRGKSLMGILPDGNLIFYPLDDFKLLSILLEIYHKKIYDTKEIETYGCIYDVGAHIGLFTLRMSKQAPNSKIIAIEANPTNFKFLSRNVLVNGLKDRVRGLNVAVGQRKGRVVLWLNKLSRGDSSVKKGHDVYSDGYLIVDVLPLDDILSDESSCYLIKIDVEGAETEVLRGLEKHHAKVNKLIMEIHISDVNVNEIHEWLYKHNFTITKTQKLYENCLLLEARNTVFQ